MSSKKDKEKKEIKLTEKQEAYCQYRMLNYSQSQAYRMAYNAQKMKPPSVHVNASKLEKNAKIALRLDELRAERIKRINYDSDSLLLTLLDMLDCDPADIMDESTGAYLPFDQWPPIYRKMIDGIDNQEVYDGHGKDREHIGDIKKIKFIPRAKILEFIGNHTKIGGFTQRHQHDISDDLREKMAQARKRASEKQ